MAGVDEASFDPSQLRTEDIREWILYRTEKIAHRPGVDEPRGIVASGIVALPAPAGNRHAGYLPSVRSLRTPRRLPVFVPESRMAYVIADINGRAGSEDFVTVRDALTVAMFYGCGIRLAELIALNRNDFSDDYRQVRIRGKGDKERIVPLVDPLRRILVHYLQLIERQNICNSQEKALILTLKGARISRSVVRRIVEQALNKEGVQGKKEPPTYCGTPLRRIC